MKNFSRQFSLILLSIFLIVISLVSPTAVGQDYVVDDLGRKVPLTESYYRVITTVPNTTEMALQLGLTDRLVGVYSRKSVLSYVPKLQEVAKGKPGVARFSINLEPTFSLSPDLALIHSSQKSSISKLENQGIEVYASEPSSIEGIMENLTEIGKLLGKPQSAKDIITHMKASLTKLREAVDHLHHKKSTLYVVDDTIYTTGSNTFLNQILKLSGLKNIFSDVEGWKPVSDEEIIQRNPELILIAANAGLSLKKLNRRSGWDQIQAIQNHSVIQLSSELTSQISQPTPKVVTGAIRLFNLVYNRELSID